MEKQYITPYGILDCFEKYVLFHLSCDHLTKEVALHILEYTDSHYKDRTYVFISHRSFNTSIDPEAYTVINQDQLIGVAIVSEIEMMQHTALAEKSFYNGAFAIFTTIDEAVVWANNMVD